MVIVIVETRKNVKQKKTRKNSENSFRKWFLEVQGMVPCVDLKLLSAVIDIWRVRSETRDLGRWMHEAPRVGKTKIKIFTKGLYEMVASGGAGTGSGGGACIFKKKNIFRLNPSAWPASRMKEFA